jgi:hypothetical protein
MNLSDWWVKPLLILLVVGAALGALKWYGHTQFVAGEASKDAEWNKNMEAAKAVAAEDSNELQRMANKAGSSAFEFSRKQLEKSNEEQKKFRESMGTAAACIVPGAAVRLLDNATDPAGTDFAGSAAQSGPAVTPADSTCADQLAIAQRNYIEVCTPNAEERDKLRQLYRDAQKVINKHNLPTPIP